MCNPRYSKLLVAIVFAVAGLAQTTQAALLFADNFNRGNNTNLNASATGKSGILSPLNWVEVKSSGEPTITNNNLIIGETGSGGGYSIAYLNHNFNDATIAALGEFTVSVDLVSTGTTSAGSIRFSGFVVGNSLAEMNGWASNNPTTSFTSDFFFGYDPTGTKEVKIFKQGITQDFQQGINLDAGATLSVRFSGITSFNSGATVNYEAFINDVSVKTGNFTWSGTDENYIALYSNYTNNRGVFDNFQVSAIPEPSAVLLYGVGILGFLGYCRRKQAKKS